MQIIEANHYVTIAYCRHRITWNTNIEPAALRLGRVKKNEITTFFSQQQSNIIFEQEF